MKKVAAGLVLGLGALVASGQEPPSAEPVATPVAAAEEQAVGGAQLQYTGMLATFDLDEERALMDAPGLDEFFVTVIGEGAKEKNFKIKNKRFKDLPGLK